MMKKFAALLLAALVAASTLLGCSAQPDPTAGGTAAVKQASLEPAQDLPVPAMEGELQSAQQTAAGANDFAFRISPLLLEEGENTIASPFSIWMALCALANGADEQAQTAMLKALGLSGLSMDAVNHGAARMLYSLTKSYTEEGESPLAIANALFVDPSQQLNTDFAQAMLDYYRAAAMNVDFSTQEAVDAVNAWSGEHTNGLIPKIVERFNPDTVLALCNAIYFSDRWEVEFDPALTGEETFRGTQGEQPVSMMKRQGEMRYYEDERLQMAALPFINGGNLYILLPRDGDAWALLQGLSGDGFSALCAKMESRMGTLKLPKFELDASFDLEPAMETMGMGRLFEDACLTKLTQQPLYLSQAVHKAVIKVDEKGTTAAAVTMMAADECGTILPELPPFEMTCDQPFVFVLCGRTYDGGDQVLFTGTMSNAN